MPSSKGEAMERSHWVMFIVVSFVIGLILGFGFAYKASRVPELEKQVQQLTRENADMKARVAAPPGDSITYSHPCRSRPA